MTKKKFNKERHTVSAINHVFGDKEATAEYQRRMIYNVLSRNLSGGQGNSVNRHKRIFGRQDYCYFNGEFRFWVWDFQDWRIWVNNQKGVSIEVDPNFGLTQTMSTLRSYWDRMGL